MKNIIIVCLLIGFNSIVYAQVPTNGLVAEYTFTNGSLNDGVGTNHAIDTGNVVDTTDRFGNAGYAKYFDGALATYISLGASSTLKPQNGTISLWVNLDAVSNNGWGMPYDPIFLIKNTNAPGSYMEGCGIYLRRSNRTILNITTEPPTNEKYFFSSTALPTGLTQWVHLVLTYDDNNLKAYMDTLLVNSISKSFVSNDFHATKDVVLGNSVNSGNSRAFNGNIDDVRIYNRVLSQSEIVALFNEADPNVPPVVYTELKSKLDGGYYKLENDTLAIKFNQEYAVSASGETINFTIYAWDRTAYSGTFNATYGINWEEIDLSPFSLVDDTYYTIEFEANKGEKYILRFKTKSS